MKSFRLFLHIFCWLKLQKVHNRYALVCFGYVSSQWMEVKQKNAKKWSWYWINSNVLTMANTLQVLRHLGRISESRIGHHRVIVLLRPQWVVVLEFFVQNVSLYCTQNVGLYCTQTQLVYKDFIQLVCTLLGYNASPFFILLNYTVLMFCVLYFTASIFVTIFFLTSR